MAQFCYWRQYLDIELIPVTDLLLWVARMDIDQNFKNLANSSIVIAVPAEKSPKNYQD